jgi:hypothetical protein
MGYVPQVTEQLSIIVDHVLISSSYTRRHAERTAQLWLQKLRDSPAPKRLNLVYLANGMMTPDSRSRSGAE